MGQPTHLHCVRPSGKDLRKFGVMGSIRTTPTLDPSLSVTNSKLVLWEFNTSQNELLLVSSRSKSSLISGGDSSESWVLVHALGLL